MTLCCICRKFDLKGSTVDREASDKELEKHLPTLKDNDFIKQKIRICIGEEPKRTLFEILNADINVSSFCLPPAYFKLGFFVFTLILFSKKKIVTVSD